MPGKTLVVTNDFPPRPGGIQSFVHGLLLHQPDESVVVYAPAWKGAEEFDAEQPFEVVRHPGSLMLPEPGVLRRARDLAASRGCDRALFGAAAPLGLLAPYLKSAGVQRFVGLTHGHEAAWAVTPGPRQLLRRIGQGLDTMTYLGEYTRRRIAGALRRQDAARMRRLVPGVDEQMFNPRAASDGDRLRDRYGIADRRVIVCVSRLMPRKGQDTLIEVLPDVRRAIPDAALLIVGGGPYRKRLTEMVQRNRLSDHVVITGSVPWEDLPAHYAAGQVFAMPCRTRNLGWDVEGLGIVYLEAGAVGLPVVAGDSGGAPDAVLDGRTGFVVHDPGQLTARLVELLADPQRARTIGTAGRQWIEQEWTWQRVSGRLTDLLAGRDPDLVL